jgi:WD40 repeat protein
VCGRILPGSAQCLSLAWHPDGSCIAVPKASRQHCAPTHTPQRPSLPSLPTHRRTLSLFFSHTGALSTYIQAPALTFLPATPIPSPAARARNHPQPSPSPSPLPPLLFLQGSGVALYDRCSWELSTTLKGGHTRDVIASAFSPNGRYLATAGLDKEVGGPASRSPLSPPLAHRALCT